MCLLMDRDYTVYATFLPVASVSFMSIVAGPEPWAWYGVAGVDVYMDGNFLGPADGSSYMVALGVHVFSATASVYDPVSDGLVYCSGFATYVPPYSGTSYGSSPAAIDIEGGLNLLVFYGSTSP
jgi:hypothetical protein